MRKSGDGSLIGRIVEACRIVSYEYLFGWFTGSAPAVGTSLGTHIRGLE